MSSFILRFRSAAAIASRAPYSKAVPPSFESRSTLCLVSSTGRSLHRNYVSKELNRSQSTSGRLWSQNEFYRQYCSTAMSKSPYTCSPRGWDGASVGTQQRSESATIATILARRSIQPTLKQHHFRRITNGTTVSAISTSDLQLPTSPAPQQQQQQQQQEAQKYVMKQCQDLHRSIMDLNERIRGPLAPQSDQGTALPLVLLVGNHSSGKSSFINYVVGRTVQTAGVAPTDDCFTILAPGTMDRDQDGPAVIGDPHLGFTPLQQFGPTLVHHTLLKIRKDLNCDFMLVDSPGMIDAPANYSGMLSGSSSNSNSMDRGYDFTGVVRWLADRADVVLLFFDPDKPGTTGETLSILLHALSGMDHKLLIILNKADQFAKIHDFARAYGSLCWNLSKVIPRKDLPRIYTMCLPVAENKFGSAASTTTGAIPAALQDLYTARDEVVAQVRKAPERRLDNVVTQLADAVSQLHMHAVMVQDLRSRWSKLYWQFKRAELLVAGTGVSITLGLSLYGESSGLAAILPSHATGFVLALTVLGSAGLYWYNASILREWERQAVTPAELSASFMRTYARAVADGDEHIAAIWQRIRDKLAAAVQSENNIGDLAVVTKSDLQQLQNILKTDIPQLRTMIAPQHYGNVDASSTR